MFTSTLNLVLRAVRQILQLMDALIFHATVCYKNAKMLFTYLIRGSRTWVVMTLRLVLFTIVLLPGWFQMLRYWLLSPLIIRNLRYGKGAKNRNLLDVYLPVPVPAPKRKRRSGKRPKPLAPVVIFVSGGAWTIGYKMWSALVARGLAKLGILCVVPDHRNFPQGDVQDMMDDVRLAVQWTVENAHRFGGDADKIVLSGQSAGAHVTLCLLVADFMKAQVDKRRVGTHIGNGKTNGVGVGGVVGQGMQGKSGVAEAQVHGLDGEESGEDDDEDVEVWEVDDEQEGEREEDGEEEGQEGQGQGALGAGVTEAGFSTPLETLYSTAILSATPVSTPASASTPSSASTSAPSSASTSAPSAPAMGLARELRVRTKSNYSGVGGAGAGAGAGSTPSSSASTPASASGGLPPSGHKDSQRRSSVSAVSDMLDTYLGDFVEINGECQSRRRRAASLRQKLRSEKGRSALLEGLLDSEEEESAERGEHGDLSSVDSGSPRVGDGGEGESEEVQVITEEEANRRAFWKDVDSDVDVDEGQDSVSSARPASAPSAPVPASAPSPSAPLKRRSKPFNVTPHVKLFIGVSGPYNLVALQSHFQERGLDASLLNWICRGDIRKHSPTIRLAEFAEAQNRLAEVQEQAQEQARMAARLAPLKGPLTSSFLSLSSPSAPISASASAPALGGWREFGEAKGPLAELAPIALFHGSHDATIPVSICTELADVLLEQGASASCRVYEGWSHTDAILEAPLSGTTRLFRDIAMVVAAATGGTGGGGKDVGVGARGRAGSRGAPVTATVTGSAVEGVLGLGFSSRAMDYSPLISMPSCITPGSLSARKLPRRPTAGTATAAARATTAYTDDGAADEGVPGSGGAAQGKKPMVSRFLVKIAREINPF